jgi:replicative DNA helicase
MDKPLPLDLDFYEKVIMYNALGDQVFLETILDYINPIYFNNKSIQTVFKVLKSFYVENKKAPNIPELKAHLVTEEQKDALREVAMSFKTLDKEFDKTLLLKNTERFLREKSVLTTVIETSIDVNAGDIDSTKILKSFENACGISLTDNIGMDYLENIDNHCNELQHVFRTISTGWKWLDKHLGGGFMAEGRALYCFFGVTNVGKSIFLGNIATNILSQNKVVVLISLEMPEQVYAKRISAQLSNIPSDDLKIRVDPLKRFLGEYKIKNSNSKLIIKEFPPKAVTVLQIKSYINKLIRKGIKPDAIILDYVNLVAPPANGLGSYEAVKQICEGIRALSYDFECPVITATQANRAAYNKAAPDAGKTGESMGLSHTVDAQFSIWTEEGDADLGIIHLGVEKNRFGPREVYTHLNINYPTLSLTEPESDGMDQIESRKSPTMTADIENSDFDTNMSSTLDMLTRLSA